MGLRARIAATFPEDGPKIFGYSGNEDMPPHVVLAVFATITLIAAGPLLLTHLLGLGTGTSSERRSPGSPRMRWCSQSPSALIRAPT